MEIVQNKYALDISVKYFFNHQDQICFKVLL